MTAFNALAELAQDLAKAATSGAEQAGHAGVLAGVHHADSPELEILGVQRISSEMNGELGATVTASQPVGITAQGPQLPDSDSLAATMAEAAVRVATAATLGST